MKYIASCSFGKDSLAMVLLLIRGGMPLDEVVFYDTGMEFQAIYNIRDKIIPILNEHNVKFTELKPKNPFLYDMLERPVVSKKHELRLGYEWCGGACRWGTFKKIKTLDTYCKDLTKYYIGIAYDEPNRLARLQLPKCSPIADAHMTEQDCLAYCREQGFNWNEPTDRTESGYIDLYDILDRVSCWCCSNKNRKELFNIYRYLPDYWEKLKYLQSRIERPMKKWSNKQYGDYGNIFEMEKVFEKELEIKGEIING